MNKPKIKFEKQIPRKGHVSICDVYINGFKWYYLDELMIKKCSGIFLFFCFAIKYRLYPTIYQKLHK